MAGESKVGVARNLPGHLQLNNSTAVITALGGLVAAVAAVGVLLFGEGIVGGGDAARRDAGSGPVGATVEELALATVQISEVDNDGNAFPSGSGAIISENGLVLTAAHLVEGVGAAFDHLEVATTDDVNKAPSGNYSADVVAADYALDLAIIKIDRVNLPFVRRADSELDILERIRILGYPGTGGETLTATVGTVSGFASEPKINGRAWIKTDAAVTGGSSGGMAVNDDGELIGVVVEFGSGSDEADLVDCRPGFADTNGDGLWDDADGCVAVGGFINALRPVKLAERLIREGKSHTPDLSTPDPYAFAEYDTSRVLVENLAFTADGITYDEAGNEVAQALASGVTEICGGWQYSGMVDGMRWDAVWYLDGRRYDGPSLARQRWTGGEVGSHLVCITSEGGLTDGMYELHISVEGALAGSKSAFVGGNHPRSTLTVKNASESPICGVFLSPSGAQNWGINRLSSDEAVKGIAVGGTRAFRLAAGSYDLSVEDCDHHVVSEQAGLEVGTATVYSVSSH